MGILDPILIRRRSFCLLLDPPASVVNGATWVYGGSTAAPLNANQVNSSAAINDGGIWHVDLTPGTWTMVLLYKAQTAGAIATIDISEDGGSSWISVGTVDTYAGSSTGSQASFTGVALSRNSTALLRFRALSKNGSSTGYQMSLCGASFRRTS